MLLSTFFCTRLASCQPIDHQTECRKRLVDSLSLFDNLSIGSGRVFALQASLFQTLTSGKIYEAQFTNRSVRKIAALCLKYEDGV